MIENISITTPSKKQHIMSVDSYARWLCLVEAMDIIDKTAEKLNVDLDKNNKWIKPLELQKYIKQRFHSMNHDFKVEEYLY